MIRVVSRVAVVSCEVGYAAASLSCEETAKNSPVPDLHEWALLSAAYMGPETVLQGRNDS